MRVMRNALLFAGLLAVSVGGGIAAAADGATPVAECDRLAGHQLDPSLPAGVPGVDAIAPEDVPAAIAACEAATRDSAEPRLAFELGRAYEFDNRPVEAMSSYRTAASGGNTLAMVAIAMLYLDGSGVAASRDEARRWFERAAALGNGMAMGNLGSMYGAGLFGSPDFAEARRWFEKAAAAGYGEAMFQLGLMDLDGDGAAASDTSAKGWFEKAAAKGIGGAYFSLGQLAEDGRAGEKDLRRAIENYKKAVDLGDPDAADALERLRCPTATKESGDPATAACFTPDE